MLLSAGAHPFLLEELFLEGRVDLRGHLSPSRHGLSHAGRVEAAGPGFLDRRHRSRWGHTHDQAIAEVAGMITFILKLEAMESCVFPDKIS